MSDAPNPMRYARIFVADERTVRQYLPAYYGVLCATDTEHGGDGDVIIQGRDVAGWTLEDYVLPRLASWLYFGKEITADEAQAVAASVREL